MSSLTRREILGASVVGAAALVAATADAAAHVHLAGPSPLADAAAQCVKTGEACLQHCLDSLATGDTLMAECSKSVREMLALAQALYSVALANGKQLKALAKISAEAAKECETQCKKHAATHAVCKACADCCAKLAAEAAKA